MTKTENLYPTRPQCETKYKMKVIELPLVKIGVLTIAAMSSVTAVVSTPDFIMSKKATHKDMNKLDITRDYLNIFF